MSQHYLRGLVLSGLAVASIACRPEETKTADGSDTKSLVLITLDTLRADHLGLYGYDKPTSPVLDALASRSLVFDHAIAQSAVTPVSHASILTGLNPYRHRLRSLHGGKDYALPEEIMTLASLMRENGRDTAAFVSAFPVTRHFGLDRGFDVFDEDFEPVEGEAVLSERGIVNSGRVQRRGDVTTALARAWIEEQSGPFFLWIHYFDVHDPLMIPPSNYLSRFPPRSGSERDRLLATYDAEIAFVDAQVGRVLQALTDEGLRDNTIIAILADHGEGLGDHGWWGHSLLYQEQLHVPFLLSVPGQDWSGRIEPLVRTIDLAPTVVELMELDCASGPCDFDGRSLLPMFEGSSDSPRVAYSESLNDLSAYYASPLRNDSFYAINDGRFKLIARYEGSASKPSLLFDLQEDPDESFDLHQTRQEEGDRLRALLESLDAIVTRRTVAPLDEETKRRLRSLGYVR